MNHLLTRIAFASAGIYPLNKECINNETNRELLRLGGINNKVEEVNPRLKKFNTFIGNFNFKSHLQNLQYLDIDLPAAFEDCYIDCNIKKDLKELLIAKETLLPTNKGEENEKTKKRTRAVFEDTSEPRILNDEERLGRLRDYKKIASSKQDLKKQKTNVKKDCLDEPIQLNFGKSQKMNEYELEEFIKEFENMNNGVIAEFVCESKADFTFCLYLPIDTETLDLSPKKDIVDIFIA